MRLSSPALLLTLALAAPVLADTPTSTGNTYDAYAMAQTETVTATVQAVNVKTRHATLRLPDGTKQTFAVDPVELADLTIRFGERISRPPRRHGSLRGNGPSGTLDAAAPFPGEREHRPASAIGHRGSGVLSGLPGAGTRRIQ